MDSIQATLKAKEKEKIQDLAERYKESALTVRRAMFLLLTFSVFCFSVLFIPDDYLVPQFGKVIKLTFFSLPISVDAFIFISPVFLIIITLYLNIFLNSIIFTQIKLWGNEHAWMDPIVAASPNHICLLIALYTQET